MRERTGAARGTGKGRDFSPKDRVDHTVFGLGTIVRIDPHRTTVAFDQSGTRKFVTSLVELSPSDAPLPPRRSRARKTEKSDKSIKTRKKKIALPA